MPLDGHAYLVSQGWEGKGSGLRKGAIAKPVAVIQKKSLSGVGKDRDEAFPFWDHVFSAAASAIKIKTTDTDDEDDDTDTPAQTISLQRTATGIISNRRPTVGTPAASTPGSSSSSGTSTPRISVMAAAKQEAARRTLYSMFFRGPVMRSDDPTPLATPQGEKTKLEAEVDQVVDAVAEKLDAVMKGGKKSRKGKEPEGSGSEEESVGPKKRKKAKDGETKEERKERKRRKLEKSAETCMDEGDSGEGCSNSLALDNGDEKAARKAERKRRKEEKRASKEEKRKRKEAQPAKVDNRSVAVTSTQTMVLSIVPNTEDSPLMGDSVVVTTSEVKSRKKKRNKDASS